MTPSTIAAPFNAIFRSETGSTFAGSGNPGRKTSLIREAAIRSTKSVSCAHRKIRSKRGASTMANAVPQLPAPIIAIDFGMRLFLELEHMLGSRSDSSDVLLVAIDNKHRRHKRSEQYRAGRMIDQIYGQRQASRSHHRSHGNIARGGHDDHEQHQHSSERNRCQIEERPDETRYRLPPVKLQENWIRMPCHYGQRRGAHPFRRTVGEPGCE